MTDKEFGNILRKGLEEALTKESPKHGLNWKKTTKKEKEKTGCNYMLYKSEDKNE